MSAKTLVVLGAAESGVGAALLGKKQGYAVFVSDRGAIQEEYKAQLSEAGIPFEEGSHDEARILSADLVVKSPGIPEKAAIVQALRGKGTELVSEIEFASWFAQGEIIAITGTNGKTTTTLLTYHLLRAAGLDAALGGNVGKSFAANVAERESPIHVLELSSFQLDDIRSFRPRIAMLLNITPDHLDRYAYKLENYARAKFRIVENQRPDDLFFYNADDLVTMSFLGSVPLPGKALGLSEHMVERGVLHAGGHTFDLARCGLKGRHNAMNALFAIHAALAMGVPPSIIQEGLESYVNAPHRMERIAEVDGVTYINDSKATNVEAAFYALQAMTSPFVWIVGGQDKGNDYSPLVALVQGRARGIVCLGVDNAKILSAFGELGIPMAEARSAQEAVQLASRMASPGDVVLLSPACASFDLFRNYEDRGDQFRAEAKALLKNKVKNE